MKNLIKLAVVMVAISVSAQATMNKKDSYELIKACQYTINKKDGTFSPFINGFILGLSQAYSFSLHQSNIDNEYAPLNSGEYARKMCSMALEIRKDENEKTGGKYDVTEFIIHLETAGYFMANFIPKKSE